MVPRVALEVPEHGVEDEGVECTFRVMALPNRWTAVKPAVPGFGHPEPARPAAPGRRSQVSTGAADGSTRPCFAGGGPPPRDPSGTFRL